MNDEANSELDRAIRTILDGDARLPPEATWTSTPPTEPGDYWWSERVGQQWSDVHRVDSRGPWSLKRGHLVRDGIWHPVPINVPPLPEGG